MTLTDGLLFLIMSLSISITGTLILYIFYERYRKNLERIEADKKKKVPYDFK